MDISLQTTLDGRHVAVVNGKSYGISVFYESTLLDGPFAFLFGGATPLWATDLAIGWHVAGIEQGRAGIAIARRAFAYYTITGDDPPAGWPRLKTPPQYYAFIGPTQAAVRTQIKLVVTQYRPDLEDDVGELIASARTVADRCGGWPDTLLIKSSVLAIEQEGERK